MDSAFLIIRAMPTSAGLRKVRTEFARAFAAEPRGRTAAGFRFLIELASMTADHGGRPTIIAGATLQNIGATFW